MSGTVECPRCGSVVDGLHALDAEMRRALSERSREELPEAICVPCYRQVSTAGGGQVSAGSTLLAQERAKEQRKLMLWKSRVNLVKRARMLMNEKAFSDAAVTYEKYLRVLEIVFDAKPGTLTPEQFKDSARTHELTVVASVYWDLLRIYDTSDRYADRQTAAASKLAQFLRFTPIFPDILRKAESFSRTAKNPGAVKSFLKAATETKGRCFIATAVFESPFAPEVLLLQAFRDDFLMKSSLGRGFVSLYEKSSPPIASWLDTRPVWRTRLRRILQRLAFAVHRLFN